MKVATWNINGVVRRLPCCWTGCPARSPTSSRCRRRRRPMPSSRRPRSPPPATARSRWASGPGTAWRSWRAAPSRSWCAARCRAIRRHPGALRRGGDRRHPVRVDLPAERQSAARTEVRLQARLVRAPDRARRDAAGERPSGGAGRRLQRRADRARHLSDDLVPRQRAAPAGAARGLRRLLQQGWTDAIRALHPEATIYTFWDYLRNRWPRNAGLRIDHLLLSESIAARLREAEVDRDERGREGASDHAPVWARLAAQARYSARTLIGV